MVEVWEYVKRFALYRNGDLPAYTADGPKRHVNNLQEFIYFASDAAYLDFLEDLFRDPLLSLSGRGAIALVDNLNVLLDSENVGYELTPFSFDEEGDVTAAPRVIHKDNRASSAIVTGPLLLLLTDPRFDVPNKEYRIALEDFRHQRYGECITRCGAAFESCLKIVCHTKKWRYKQDDTARTLVDTVMKCGGLESYVEQTLILVATLRNKKSSSHGGGVTERVALQEDAQLALDLSATAIKYIVSRTLGGQ